MALVFFLLTIVSISLLMFGLVKPGKVFLGATSTRSKAAKIYGVATFILLIAFVVAVPKEKKEESSQASTPVAPKTSQMDNKSTNEKTVPQASLKTPIQTLQESLGGIGKDISIEEINKDAKEQYRIVAKYSPKSIWSPSFYVSSIADQLLTVGKKAKESGLPISAIVIQGIAPSVDKYGNESSSEAMTLTLSGEDISKVNWANVNSWQLLNLTDSYLRPLGRSAVIEYCQEEANLKYAKEFCRSAIFGKK